MTIRIKKKERETISVDKKIFIILGVIAILVVPKILNINFIANLFNEKEEASENINLTEAYVSKIKESTIEVSVNDEIVSVSLIGANTSNPDSELGIKTTEYLQKFLNEGQKVYLEYEPDLYNENSVYLWLSDEVTSSKKDVESKMLNGILISKGYAVNAIISSNPDYNNYFGVIRYNAEKNKVGFWKYPEFATTMEGEK